MTLLFDYVHFIFNGIIECYWKIYKLRPWRKRRKLSSHQQQQPKIRPPRPIDTVFDPTRYRQYNIILRDVLNSITKNNNMVIQKFSWNVDILLDNNTYFISSIKNKPLTYNWFFNDDISYMFTSDLCILPNYSSIVFNENIKYTLSIKNAGGSSEISEALSMYYMQSRFGAYNFVPEMEINYYTESSICDYVMLVNDVPIGVSVTRAFSYPRNKIISPIFARSLLLKKMFGIASAKHSISKKYSFDKSIIHIWCKSWDDIDLISDAFVKIVESDIYDIYKDIHVICSLCTSDFIYTNLVL